MNYDYVDFKQQFFVWRVVATDVKALFKKQMTLEERIAPDTKYFHGIEKARNFARAHREPHYAIAVT